MSSIRFSVRCTPTAIINPAGLLTSISFESEGRLSEALAAAAESAAIIAENFDSTPGAAIIVQRNIDVAALRPNPDGTPSAALLKLNALLNERLRAALPALATNDTKLLNAALASTSPQLVSLSVERAHKPAAARAATKSDCKRGFCYRLPVEYTVGAKFFDGTSHENAVFVPNGSDVYSAALNRGAFTKWTNAVTLTNGMPSKYDVNIDGSELEALAALPADIVGGMIAGITKKGQLFDARSTLITAEAGRDAKLEEARLARAERLSAENAMVLDPVNTFAFSAGTPLAGTVQGRVLRRGNEDAADTNTNDSGTRRQSQGNDGTGDTNGAG